MKNITDKELYDIFGFNSNIKRLSNEIIIEINHDYSYNELYVIKNDDIIFHTFGINKEWSDIINQEIEVEYNNKLITFHNLYTVKQFIIAKDCLSYEHSINEW